MNMTHVFRTKSWESKAFHVITVEAGKTHEVDESFEICRGSARLLPMFSTQSLWSQSHEGCPCLPHKVLGGCSSVSCANGQAGKTQGVEESFETRRGSSRLKF